MFNNNVDMYFTLSFFYRLVFKHLWGIHWSMTEESIYKKYNLTIDGKKTFVYALKSLTVEEAKKELKLRFKDSKVTGIKSE